MLTLVSIKHGAKYFMLTRINMTIKYEHDAGGKYKTIKA